MLPHQSCKARAWGGGCFTVSVQLEAQDGKEGVKGWRRMMQRGISECSCWWFTLLWQITEKRKEYSCDGEYQLKDYFYTLSRTSWMLNPKTDFSTAGTQPSHPKLDATTTKIQSHDPHWMQLHRDAFPALLKLKEGDQQGFHSLKVKSIPKSTFNRILTFDRVLGVCVWRERFRVFIGERKHLHIIQTRNHRDPWLILQHPTGVMEGHSPQVWCSESSPCNDTCTPSTSLQSCRLLWHRQLAITALGHPTSCFAWWISATGLINPQPPLLSLQMPAVIHLGEK